MIHGDGFPDEYDYWILVGRNAEILEHKQKEMDALCSLADGYTRKMNWKEWRENDDLDLLAVLGTVNHFVNGDYEISILGIDVLYETCKMDLKK